jgi:GH15 family glucan-1,4-alpha-glucosidase
VIWDLLLKADPEGPPLIAVTAYAHRLSDHRDHPFCVLLQHTVVSMKRRYREDTVILETERYNETGRVRVTDFLAWHGGASALICIVEELKGSVPMELSMRLRFRYGQVSPWVQAHKRGMIAQMGPDRVTLDSPLDLSIDSDTATAAFMIRKGESVAFICSYFRSVRCTKRTKKAGLTGSAGSTCHAIGQVPTRQLGSIVAG